jgi:carbonic anhydrase/acetyltransferase-like protein (isoleucine patch superfamily)
MFKTYTRLQQFTSRIIFKLLFSHRFKKFGRKTILVSPDKIEGEEYITLEDNVSINSMAWLLALEQGNAKPELLVKRGAVIGRFSHIVALQHVEIERNVLIADKVYISDNIHDYSDINIPIMKQALLFKAPVIIGENSWIGENVSIIGASVGKHCVIGANAVVTNDIPDYSVAVGSPAKVIKKFNIEKNEWQKV